jgi:hypothetical protein
LAAEKHHERGLKILNLILLGCVVVLSVTYLCLGDAAAIQHDIYILMMAAWCAYILFYVAMVALSYAGGKLTWRSFSPPHLGRSYGRWSGLPEDEFPFTTPGDRDSKRSKDDPEDR